MSASPVVAAAPPLTTSRESDVRFRVTRRAHQSAFERVFELGRDAFETMESGAKDGVLPHGG